MPVHCSKSYKVNVTRHQNLQKMKMHCWSC